MPFNLYLSGRADVNDAAALLAAFGARAAEEAAARANRSRTIGNHLHFCRWRQVGRLLTIMAHGEPLGTVH